MRRDKPWFGPMRTFGKAVVPLTWQGYAITLAFLLGLGLLRLETDLARRSVASALMAIAYAALVVLTWGDPESDAPLDWRKAFFNRGTLVWLLVLTVIAAAMVVAGFYGARPLH